MTKGEAIVTMIRDGVKVRNPEWDIKQFLYWDAVDEVFRDETSSIETEAVLSTRGNIEIYQEPEAMRKFYRRKWVICDRTGALRTELSWYPDKIDWDFAHRWAKHWSDEWEEIEV